jgi:lysophospholipase L1-like esterase
MSSNSDPKAGAVPLRSRFGGVALNIGLFFFTLLLCFAILEITLRFCGYGNLEIYEPDAKLYWKLKPDQDCYTKIDHKPVHVNSHGTRGPEFSAEKPADTIRILSLGDSRTFGWGLTEAETYSDRLQRLLQGQVGKKKKVEVINAGVNAWSYMQMLVYFRETGIKYNPDCVIIGDANLWTQFSEKSDPEFVKKFLNRVRLKNFLRHFAAYHYFIEVKLKDFYEKQRTKFIPIDPKQDTLFKEQQQKDPNAVFKTAIEDLCKLASSRGVKPVLLNIPSLDELQSTNQSDMLKVKTAVSQSCNVPLADLTPQLQLEQKRNVLYLDADPVHLNQAGNQIIAQQLFETIKNMMVP